MKIPLLRFPASRPLLKKLTTKRQLRRIAPIAGGLAVLILLVVVLTLVLSAGNGDGNQHAGSETYKEQLRDRVTTEDGAPRDGRDPASQKQNSLASSASKPTGTSQRTSSPASGVVGSHDHHASHGDVYGDPEQTGLGANGCYIDYGTGGQCLPAHAAEGGVLTCQGVRTHGGFPDGIKVTGTDRFNLDTNHNGTACDASD